MTTRTTIPTRIYYVRTVTVHDRPENRGPTFSPVAKGTRVSHDRPARDCADAVRDFNSTVAGIMDSSADFIASVEVFSRDLFGNNPRTVRRRMRRERCADGSVRAEE